MHPPYERHFIRLHGLTACVRTAGNASNPPLLLLPSQLVLARSYTPLIRLIGRHFHVIVPELPGFGRASALRRAWSLSAYAKFLAQLIETMELPRLPIIGHSNSAPVAALLAANRCDLISHLVIVDTVGVNPAANLPQILLGRAIDGLWELPLTLTGFHHPLFNLLMHPRNTLYEIYLATHTRLEAIAYRIEVPTLIGWGKNDFTTPPGGAIRLQRMIPRSRLYCSRFGSHDWLITRCREFAQVLMEFLQEEHPSKGEAITPRRMISASPGR